MGQRGKSRAWPYLVALNEALSKPLTALSSGLVKLEEAWEQVDHDKDTQQIKADVQAIRQALSETQDDALGGELGELTVFSGLSPSDLRSIVTRRARRLGLISDAERLSEYRRHLLAEYEYADFAGITQMTTVVSVRLDDLFVPLAAAPEAEVRAVSDEETALLEEMERTRDPRERASIEARLGEKVPRGFRRAADDRATAVPELVRREGKVVLLGDPGAGKTTLVKWLARQCAKGAEASAEALGCTRDLLPVVVPIARYGAALQEDDGLRLHEHIRCELDRYEGDGFGELVLERAEEGRCLFLLDGLDEIPDPKWRLSAARGVNELLGRFSRSAFLVTSRIVGYSVCRVTGGAAHYVLEGFSDEDIKRFARQWSQAYERASHPGAANLDRARRQAEDLSEAVFDEAHPQIVEFARNPLLLTILALIKQRRVELPERRVQLYDTALETLMESWVRARSIGGPVRGMDLDTGESMRVWRRVAYWIHRERPAGTAHRTDLMRELQSALHEEKGLEADEAEGTAADYLRTAAERAGLLLARGENMFGFLHQTFEEYLVAMYLASPPHRAFEKLRPHLHDPRWREVTLLTAGYIGDIQRQPALAGELVDYIRTAASSYDEILHRDLLLAAECLAEHTPVDRKCEHAVLANVCAVLQREDLAGDELNEVVDVLGRIGHLRPSPANASSLVKLMAHESEWVRLLAGVALSSASGEQVELALTSALGDANDSVAGGAAAVLLQRGRLGRDVLAGLARGLADLLVPDFVVRTARSQSSVVVSHLLSIIKDEAGQGRESAVSALGQLAGTDASVVSALVALLKDQHSEVRAEAARRLGRLEDAEPSIVGALLACLRDEDAGVRANAVEGLTRLGATDPAVVARLLCCLEDDAFQVRWIAADALGRFGASGPPVVAALLRCLEDDDGRVRASAAGALGELGGAQPSVVSALVACFRDEDSDVRIEAAMSVGHLGATDASVRPTLLACLKDDDPNVRTSAAWAMGRLPADGPGVASLVACLEDRDADVRESAADTLGELRASNPAAIAALIRRLKDPSPAVRSRASEALGKLGVTDPSALTALAVRLADGDRGPRMSAGWALEKLTPLPESVLEIVRGRLTHGDREMQWMAARLLASSEQTNG